MTLSAPPAYPGLGQPCNGCGRCCIIHPCRLARDYAGVREGPCPILIRDGAAWRCGLTIEPHRHIPGLAGKPFADAALAPMFAEALGIGRGCAIQTSSAAPPPRREACSRGQHWTPIGGQL